jgi:hypothetical protein
MSPDIPSPTHPFTHASLHPRIPQTRRLEKPGEKY